MYSSRNSDEKMLCAHWISSFLPTSVQVHPSTHPPLRRSLGPYLLPPLVRSGPQCCAILETLGRVSRATLLTLLNPLLPPFPSFHGATCFSLGPFYLTSHSCDRQSTGLVGRVLYFIAFFPPTSSLP